MIVLLDITGETLLICKSFGHHHHANKLLEVYLSIAIHVGFPNHLVDFIVSEFLAEVGHDQLELGRRNVTVVVLIEYFEGLG